jgi:chromatin assembly factor 1 subunit B
MLTCFILRQPSLVVRPNPVLFQLPETAVVEVATKENANAAASSLSPKNTAAPSASRSTSSPSAVSLPYKSIFCVLTNDSVLIYDTHHDVPLSVVRGLHYSNLADATWSQDGHSLIVCSTDGYLSILRFAPGELGKVYTPPPLPPVPIETAVTTTTTVSNTTPVAALGVSTNGGNVVSAANSSSRSNSTVPPTMMVRPKPKKSMALAATSNNIKPLPPCEPGSVAVLEEPPMKRSKTSHVNDVSGDSLSMTAQPLASSSCASNNKRPASVALGEEGNDDDHDETVKAVDKLSLGNDNADNNNNTTNVAPVALAKKKKRVQPILLSSA